MPTLDAINEQIAAQLGMGLAGRTRLALRATAGAATLLKFADLTPLLAPPATVCVMGLGTSSGFGLVLLEPGVAEALLGAALGDRTGREQEAAAEGRRDLTTVEQLVLRRLLGVLTEAMARCWAPVIPFRPEVLRIEMDPRMANIAPPSDVGIVSAFELTGGLEGRLQVVIPYAAVEPAKAQLAAPRQLAQRADQKVAEALAGELEQVRVEVRGLLGRAVIPFSRLLSLEPGETLLLDSDENRPLPVLVQGREKLRARPSVSGGAMALVVDTAVSGMRPPVPPGARAQPQRSDPR
jgi:flagellar motor switch protein FliM